MFSGIPCLVTNISSIWTYPSKHSVGINQPHKDSPVASSIAKCKEDFLPFWNQSWGVPSIIIKIPLCGDGSLNGCVSYSLLKHLCLIGLIQWNFSYNDSKKE